MNYEFGQGSHESGDQQDTIPDRFDELTMNPTEEPRVLSAEEIAERNREEYERPSLKNDTGREGTTLLGNDGSDATRIQEKLKNNELLTCEDIIALSPGDINFEGVQDVFNALGFDKGTDFDIKTKGLIYDEGGNGSETDYKVSFRNPDGTYTRMSFTRVENPNDKNKMDVQLIAIRGAESDCNVGYRNRIGDANAGPHRNTSKIGEAFFDSTKREITNINIHNY